MKIRLLDLVFDGVGPFAEKTQFPLDGGHGIVLAENNLGKTSTIDLVRWLLIGDEAKNQFRSLEPDGILFKDRLKTIGQGSVTAVVDVEGKGTFKIRRTEIRGKMQSHLEVFTVEGSKETAVDSPTHFLHETFPSERVGFNLLTGEHIKEFQEGLSGPRVKKSVEKLLHIPEITSAAEALQGVERELTLRATKAKKVDKTALAAKDKYEANEAQIADLRSSIKALDQAIETGTVQLDDKKIAIGEARAGATVSPEDIKRTEQAITDYRGAFERQLDEAREVLTPMWRDLAVHAARPVINDSLRVLKRYEEQLAQWQEGVGKAKEFERLAGETTCLCLRPMDEPTKERLRQESEALRVAQPTAPKAAAVEQWKLLQWAASKPPKAKIAKLRGHLERLRESRASLLKEEQRLVDLESALDQDVRDRIKSLEQEIKDLGAEVEKNRKWRVDMRTELEALTAKNARLTTQMRKAGIGSIDIDLADKAKEYADAFREVLERALPHYKEALRTEVEDIFRALYQHDSTLTVTFEQGSYLPKVTYQKNGRTHDLVISEGTKVRLGVALLLGLRRVAAEHPFLFLDNPFAALDDEGTRRLVVLLSEEDDQVVILTKNRLTPTEAGHLEQMNPKCMEFTWNSEHGDATAGYTGIDGRELENLVVEVTA